MNGTGNTQDHGLTTEQIAAAGTRAGQEDIPQPASRERVDDGYADDARLTAGPAASAGTLLSRSSEQAPAD